jgi:hypothetical protein
MELAVAKAKSTRDKPRHDLADTGDAERERSAA